MNFLKLSQLSQLSMITICCVALLQGCGENAMQPVEKRQAPAFTLELFDGRSSIRLEDQRGHPVVVNFFASWCIPCGEEAPALEEIYQEYRQKGVRLIGVASQDTQDKAYGFVKKHGLTFPAGLDKTGEIREAYGVYGMPTTFFIDRTGTIQYFHVGGVTKDLMKYELEKLL